MKVNIEKLSGSKVKLKIEVPAKNVEEKLDEAAKRLSKNMNVPGFRPGKVPKEIIKQQVGEMKLWQEACSMSFPQAYAKVIVDNKIEAIGQPMINVEKMAPNNALVFTAEVAELPKIEMPNYKKIKVKQKKIKVKDEDVEKTLKHLQNTRAKQKKVDRPAKSGDAVIVNFKTYLDKIPVDKGESKNHPVVIGEKRFIPGFEEKLIGLKAGDKKEFTLEFPKNYHQKNLAGKNVEFKIEVKEAQEREVPELNDDFAKTLGKFKNMADLKEKMKENILKEAEQKEKGRAEMELMDKIADEIKVEIPEILLDAEVNKMMQEMKGMVKASGGEFDKYLQSIKKTEDSLIEEFKKKAAQRVKIGLILREIAKQEEIKISPEEIDEEVKKTTAKFQHDKKMMEQVQGTEYRDYVASLLQNKKVFEILRKECIK